MSGNKMYMSLQSRDQGWRIDGSRDGRRDGRDGGVLKALASHHCGPGLISLSPRYMRVEFNLLLVLVLAPRVFLWVLWFSSLHKNQHFQIPIRSGNSG